MFPVGDFNFVVAGIATVAATVGYACTRRLSQSIYQPSIETLREDLDRETRPTEKESTVVPLEGHLMDTDLMPLNEQSNNPIATFTTTATPSRKDSLKRKIPHDGFDEPEKEVLLDYPHNLANIYPNKRSRTPSSDSEASTPIIPPSTTLNTTVPVKSDEDIEIPIVPSDPIVVATPAPEPPRTPSPVAEELSPRQPSPTPAPVSPPPIRVATPQPATPARNVFPLPLTPKPFSSPSGGFAAFSPSGGFAAFAGSTSPFATISKPKLSGGSSFKSSRSIWSSGDLTSHQNEEEATDALAPAFKPKPEPADSHAIVEAKATPLHPTEKYTHTTGEEDEDVELEQKGVKLFVKRGDKDFSDAVFGHIKLLSHRKTLEERILFRREPLWKVSMNVRVNPAVRCTYSPKENIIRLTLKEFVEKTSELDFGSEGKQEVVVYALKPGRSCSKQDFKDFAEALVKSSHFGVSPKTSPP